jgi:type II secretory pathway predicted ATPase ExeA
MYYEFFGLRDAPFKFLPSNVLFLSSPHLEGLAALEWAFQEPSGLTLLVGEVGTGKTMLIHSLIARIKDPNVRMAQISDPTMTFEQMLGVILQQLRINPIGKDKLACLQALRTFVSDPAGTSRVILIFDEAQGLSDEVLEELRLLSNSRPPERHALQIILVGQPELVQRLTDPRLRALNQRIGARAVLRPLRGEEIHDYVNCLLQAQGARRELIPRQALEEVAALSGGIPRKINNICHNAFLHAYLERSRVVQPRHVRAASMELENLLHASDSRFARTARNLLDWIPLNRRALLAGGVVAAVLVAALALEFGMPRRDSGNDSQAVVKSGPGAETHGATNPNLAHQNQKHEPASGAVVAAVPPAPGGTENGAARPQTNASIVSGTLTSRTAAYASVPPSAPAHPMAAQNVPRATRPLPAAPAPSAKTSVAAAQPLTAPADRELSYRQKRKLAYEIRRAENSFQSGRYINSIYHSKRALLIDPENAEMRSLLQRAQAARSNSKTTYEEDEEETTVSSSNTASAIVPAPKGPAIPPAPVAPIPAADSSSAASPDNGSKPTGSYSSTSRHLHSFAEMARAEISEGDASMRAGDYKKALVKFLTAETLDPSQDLSDRINRARQAMREPDRFNYGSGAATSTSDPDFAR